MTISTLLMILALAAGSANSLTIESDPAEIRPSKIASQCWINGVWYNPCPEAPPPHPGPDIVPEIQQP